MIDGQPLTGITLKRGAPRLLVAALALTCCSCQGMRSYVASTDATPQGSAVVTGERTPATSALSTAPSPPASRGSLSDDRRPAPSTGVAQVGHSQPAVAQEVTSSMPYPRAPANPIAPGSVMAMSGIPQHSAPCPSCSHGCGPDAASSCGGWVAPNMAPPWREDEYLCDGGDQGTAVRVRDDWSVDGLDLEDTVVHYDTLDGHTHIEPTNRVCVYAPRFAAARKIYGVLQYNQLDRVAGVAQPLPPEGLGEVQIATTAVQPVQPELNLGTEAASGLRERTPPVLVDNAQGLTGAHGGLLPFEDFTLIRRGFLDNSEKARLAARVQAALAWSHALAVQVLIDNIQAHEEVSEVTTGTVTLYEQGDSRLRVCKIASREDARPGETVEFTLRFDNVGGQAIGNVTVIDNLTTRLEYVEDSQQCTLKANFAAVENQGESLVLRWEIVDPMPVGQGGVIRFKCRVR